MSKKILLLFTFCAILFLYMAHLKNQSNIQRINPSNVDISAFNEGDLILRQGLDYDSYIITKLSNSLYSHIGIIVLKNNSLFVIHATTDDDQNHLNQVIISPIDNFIKNSKQLLVLRDNMLSEDNRVKIIKFVQNKLGVPFGMQSYKEYCSSLINHAYKSVSINLNLKKSYVELFLHQEVIYPEAFLHNKRFEVVYKY